MRPDAVVDLLNNIFNTEILRKFLLLLVLPLKCLAQTVDLDFLVQKIKVDYPGYNDKTKHTDFDSFVKRTIAENKTDTFKSMSKIVGFFHDRHLDLFRSKDSIDTTACNKKSNQIQHYFSSSFPKKKYEGYWISEYNHCVIAIKQTNKNPLRYQGYVVECRDSTTIYPGMTYYEFEKKNKRNFFTKATSSYSGDVFYVNSEFRNDSVFTIGPYNKWKKLNHYNYPLLKTLPLPSDDATGHWIDSNNYLITIPTSTSLNGQIVDSILKSNTLITSRVKNLIIDIRGNTGGTVKAFTPLLPLLYTNPILKINYAAYCTKDDVENTKKQIEYYVNQKNLDSTFLKDWISWVDKEENNIGKFIVGTQDTIKYDIILPYPKHVAFIINYGCQSAAEIILLNARQSKKVMFFGEHTMGAVDYLDYYPIELPSQKYQLYMPTTKRVISPEGKKLDGIGIYPDITISDGEKDWVDFVKRYYEKH